MGVGSPSGVGGPERLGPLGALAGSVVVDKEAVPSSLNVGVALYALPVETIVPVDLKDNCACCVVYSSIANNV